MAVGNHARMPAERGVARTGRPYAPEGSPLERVERYRRLTVFCHRCGSPLPMNAACAVSTIRPGWRPTHRFYHPSCLR
jgi:hypothetical protein